jgi:type IV pilus assembly protein PilQ
VRGKGDKRTNSIIVEAIPDDLEKIKTLVDRVDQQTPQVKIATRVIEILKNVDNFFGIDWGSSQQFDPSRGLGFGNLAFPNSMASDFAVDTGTGRNGKGGSMNINFGSINNAIQLDLSLRLSEMNNYSRSLQNSTVIVLDNESATIEAGQIDYFPIQAAAGAGGGTQTQMASVEYTLKLEVKPKVTADGAVQMQIKLDNSSPKAANSGAQTSKNMRTINTSLLRQNGETAVIGGLYTTLNRKTTQGIPYLSKLPIVGALFESTGTVEDKRELMIMVTPTVINSDKSLAERVITPPANKEPQELHDDKEDMSPL